MTYTKAHSCESTAETLDLRSGFTHACQPATKLLVPKRSNRNQSRRLSDAILCRHVGRRPCALCARGAQHHRRRVGTGMLALLIHRLGRKTIRRGTLNVIGPDSLSARILCLVLEALDELVESHSNESAERWAKPVDPVVARELAVDDSRANTARRVQAAARVVYAGQFSNKEGQANTNGRNERRLVLLSGHHEDRKDELRGQEHLDE